MKYRNIYRNRDINNYEVNKGDYLVEVGTFIPMKQQIADLKRAGIDLAAWRQLHAEYANGISDDYLDDYEDMTKDMTTDEIDIFKAKLKFRNLMKNEIFAKYASRIKDEKDLQEVLHAVNTSEAKASEVAPARQVEKSEEKSTE